MKAGAPDVHLAANPKPRLRYWSLRFMIAVIPFSTGVCFAQNSFDFNVNCQQAYHEIIHLKLGQGQAMLDAEKKKNPNNLIPYFLEDYIDFFILYFTEDSQEYRRRFDHFDQRLKLMSQGDQRSPFFLFTKSTIHFQWAAIRIKFGENWNAGWEFRRSFLEIEDNSKRFPDFSPNRMLVGAMEVAAGTIPPGYQWLSNLLGIHGTIRKGMQTLERFIEDPEPMSELFHEEGVFYYLYLRFYIDNKRKETLEYIHTAQLDTRNNHLFAYLAANLMVNAQESAAAEKVIAERNTDPVYQDLPVWDFELGSARLNHLEPDAAEYLNRFIIRFKGRFYVKEVLQKLSWYYWLHEDSTKAAEYRQLILKKGTTDTEADKQALQEARSGKWPSRVLLKARLLDDGGYFSEALATLQGRSSADFESLEEQVEFAYRLGRIYDDLGREDEAIAAYLSTIKKGAGLKSYYAARAALQTGYIYERRNDCEHALAYFRSCMDLKDHEYKNSLDQKAKAGISRCQNP